MTEQQNPQAQAQSEAQVQRISTERLLIPIVGMTPLIVHAWSDKAKRIMLEAQQGVKKPKAHRDPQADYEDSLYRTETGFGFPTLAFKAATVSAARLYGKTLKMTELRAMLFFAGVPSADKATTLTEITGEPRMREDMVRVGMGTDLRYRGEFLDWTATLDVTYVASALDRSAVLNIIEAGGMSIGVGEWRPEKDGQNGCYRLDDTRTVQVVG